MSVEIAAPGGDFRVGGEAGGVLQQTYDPIALMPHAECAVLSYRAPLPSAC